MHRRLMTVAEPSTAARPMSTAVLIGSIEAIEVDDGRLAAAVQLSRSGERVALCVPGPLWPCVRQYLCSEVEVRGRLRRNPRNGRMVLHLQSVDLVELCPTTRPQ
jgi:hypothetical protein